jgi:nucleotidyltransferase/DNA polymerase involved in DNA repair
VDYCQVETSCKRALRSRPFIIAHREVILDASQEAVALGITRAMGTDSVERAFPQVHIERPLFAAGNQSFIVYVIQEREPLTAMRARYKMEVDLASLGCEQASTGSVTAMSSSQA